MAVQKRTQLKRSKVTYEDDLMRRLSDPEYAIGYLNEAIEEKDNRVFLLALRDVAQAWGGMTELSRKAKIPRISLYKVLSKNGNPELDTLRNIVKVFGLRIALIPEHSHNYRRAA